jgi:hypothetical protein
LLFTKKEGVSCAEVLIQSPRAVRLHGTAAKQALPSRLAKDAGEEPIFLDIAAGTQWAPISLPPSFTDYEGFILLAGEAAPEVSVCTTRVQTTGFLTGLRWSADYRYPRMRLDIAGIYGSHNLQDGITRPYTLPRSWISAGEKEPAVLLEWEKAEEFREAVLYFNPDLSGEIPSSIQCSLDPHHFFTPRTGMPPELVKDFRVELRRDGTWTTVNETHDNWRRRVSVIFPEKTRGDALRIVIESTYGSPRAEIFEIEIY